MTRTSQVEASLRRVEQHMGTVVTLHAAGIDHDVADRFFEQVRRLEVLLSRFRNDSEISRIARGELAVDDAHPPRS